MPGSFTESSKIACAEIQPLIAAGKRSAAQHGRCSDACQAASELLGCITDLQSLKKSIGNLHHGLTAGVFSYNDGSSIHEASMFFYSGSKPAQMRCFNEAVATRIERCSPAMTLTSLLFFCSLYSARAQDRSIVEQNPSSSAQIPVSSARTRPVIKLA